MQTRADQRAGRVPPQAGGQADHDRRVRRHRARGRHGRPLPGHLALQHQAAVAPRLPRRGQRLQAPDGGVPLVRHLLRHRGRRLLRHRGASTATGRSPPRRSPSPPTGKRRRTPGSTRSTRSAGAGGQPARRPAARPTPTPPPPRGGRSNPSPEVRTRRRSTPAAASSGYWMLGADGKVYAFGDASTSAPPTLPAGRTAADLEPTPTGNGYWVVDTRRATSTPSATPRSLGGIAGRPAGRRRDGDQPVGHPVGQGLLDLHQQGPGRPLRRRRVLRRHVPGRRSTGRSSTRSPRRPARATTWSAPTAASSPSATPTSTAPWAARSSTPRCSPSSPTATAWATGWWPPTAASSPSTPRSGARWATRKLNKPVTGMVPFGNGYLMVGEDGGIFNFSNQAVLRLPRRQPAGPADRGGRRPRRPNNLSLP